MNELNADEFHADELSVDEMNADELNEDELNADEMNADELSADELNAEETGIQQDVTYFCEDVELGPNCFDIWPETSGPLLKLSMNDKTKDVILRPEGNPEKDIRVHKCVLVSQSQYFDVS